MFKNILFIFCILLLITTMATAAEVLIDKLSVRPGGEVTLKGETITLYAGSFNVGDNFIELIRETDIKFPFKNRVTLISIVPSIDTPVCELQTHEIGESKDIHQKVDLVTISRDLPMAQGRFAKEAELENIQYVSDYKSGSFGKTTGLMMKGKELLARSLVVIDKEGVVRYLQVVPEVTHLPDIAHAIKIANELVEQ